MPEGRPIELHPPLGGVRGDLVPYDIPEGYLWRSTNVLDRYGKIRTRPGLQAAATIGPGARLSGGQTLRTVAGTTHIVAATLTKWYRLNANAWTDISGAFTFTNDADNPTRFAVFPAAGINWLIGVNNTDIPKKWDGTSAALVSVGGTPPIAKDVTVAGNFVVLGNVVEAGVRSSSRIRVSDFNNLDLWTQYGPADLTDTNDDIVAVRALTRTSFAIYKDKSIWMAWAELGLFPFRFETVEYRPGPVSPSAVVRVGQEHYYFGTDGRIHRFNGEGAQVVSRPIEAFLQNANLPTAFRSVNRARCWGVFSAVDRTVWFFYPGLLISDPVHGISYNVDTGAQYLHVFPFALTAGWEGDDVASLSWSDLTGTWDAIGPGSYPTWDSFGGTLEQTSFIGSSLGQVYRQRYGASDDGQAVPTIWETPLKPWLGMAQTHHLDGIESFFERIEDGPLVRIDVGASDALAEPVDPVYTTLGNHDTNLATRQKFTLPTLDMRFWSIKFAAASASPIQWLGGMAAAWTEEVPEAGVERLTMVEIPLLTITPTEGSETWLVTGAFATDYMVALQFNWPTMYSVTGQTPTQFTLTFGTPAPAGAIIRAKVLPNT